MDNKLQYKGRNPNKTFDIGVILSKSRNTLWDKLPIEICEIIYHYYISLRQQMVKSYLPELTDNDIYTEMRYRNRKCFVAFNLGRSEIYDRALSNIGIFDIVGDTNTLLYNNDEIESANEIVNMTIRTNENMPDFIIRTDYYTINDLYDAINAHCAIYNTENVDTCGNILSAITKWTNMSNEDRHAFCVENFNKFKMDFINNEHIVTNSYRFNTLRICCEYNLHRFMNIG
tara:strand:- start:1641 stop:2330 length:690 start_codon:yes stop_codon:yes gene_type:complete